MTTTTTTATTTITTPTINSRESYLAYRANWKATYKKLSETIRENKKLMKDGMRKGLSTGNLQYHLAADRITAATMLEELAAVKEIARQHTAKQRALKAEVAMT